MSLLNTFVVLSGLFPMPVPPPIEHTDIENLLYDITNYVSIYCLLPLTIVVAFYGFAVRWWESRLGRSIFGLLVALSGLFTLILYRRFFGEFPGYFVFALIVYTMLAVAITALVIVFFLERADGRTVVEVPIARTTGSHPIIPTSSPGRGN